MYYGRRTIADETNSTKQYINMKKTKNNNSKNLHTSFDSFASEFSNTRQSFWKEFNLFVPFLTSKRAVLDLGCGNGRLSKFLRTKNYTGEYVGIDISPRLIETAKKTFPNEKFIETSMTFLPIKSESIDLVIASASIHHLNTKKLRSRMVREVERVLNKDGQFIGLVWNMHQPRFFTLWLKVFNGWRNIIVPWKSKEGKTINRYYYAFNKHILRKLLETSFKDISITYVSGTNKKGLFTGRNIFFSCSKKNKDYTL